MAIATLALNPLGAAEKAAGEGFSYALGAPAAVKSISNLTKLGAQAAKGATQIGASGALAATKAVGGQLAKAAAAGLIFEGAVRPAFEGAVSVAANTLGIHTDAPQPPTVTSLLQSAALSVLLAGHGIEFKDIPASQVTSAMVRGKVREDLGIPLDSTDPQRIAQVTSYLQSKGVPIDPSNAQALTAPLSAGEQHLYSDLSAKIDAMKAAGKFDGKTGDFVPATQATVPGASGNGAVTLSGGVAAIDKASGGGEPARPSPPGSSSLHAPLPPRSSAPPGSDEAGTPSRNNPADTRQNPLFDPVAEGTVKPASVPRAGADQPKGGNGQVLADGAGATPAEIAASRGGPTGGKRTGQRRVRAALTTQAQTQGDGAMTCWRCGAASKDPADFHLGHRNVPTSAGGNLSPANVALEGAACNLSAGNRGAPSAGMSCAERGGPGAPYGRANQEPK